MSAGRFKEASSNQHQALLLEALIPEWITVGAVNSSVQ